MSGYACQNALRSLPSDERAYLWLTATDTATPQEIWEILREVSAVQQETARRMQETDQLLTRQARAADRRRSHRSHPRRLTALPRVCDGIGVGTRTDADDE